MKALLRKDFYVLSTSLKSVLLTWVVFPLVALINPEFSSFILYVGLVAGTLSSTLISYEEREKWPLFAGTLPLSKKQVVTERYVSTLIMMLISSLIGAVIMLTYVLRGAPEYASAGLLVQNFATSLVMPSLLLPVTYRFGIEKGRYIVMFLVIAIAMLTPQMATMLTSEGSASAFILPLMLVGSIVLYAVSYLLSLKWYVNKDVH